MKNSILSVAFFISACTGTMQGAVRGTGERVAFTFEQGIDSDTYSAIIGAETFKGRAVMDGATSIYATAFDTSLFGQTTTNRFVAVLLGDKGNSLNCSMRYADSSGFTTSGGVGVCNHSDGRIIDVVW